MAEEYYTTKQAREVLKLSKSEMQYFLTRGMVPHLKRTRTGRALLTERQINWLKTLLLLRRCGFSASELRKYCRLCTVGVETLAERKAILETKRQQVLQDLDVMHDNLDFLNRKQEFLVLFHNPR